MVKNTTKAAATPAKDEAPASDKPKRKLLTPEEKVAKLERDLAEARAKASEKDRKRFAEVADKISKLEAKRAEINLQLDGLAGERDAIVARVPELVNEQVPSEA